MAVQPKSMSKRRSSRARRVSWISVLDTVAIVSWGILLLKYWITDKINVLLHPDYVWLANSAGFFLVGLGLFKLYQLIRILLNKPVRGGQSASMQHFSLFPPGWGSAMLLLVALYGIQFTPRPFASSIAMQRGITDTLIMTRSQPQAFRGNANPEDRTIIDWVRTINVYPEPDAYSGQVVDVEGFVIHTPNLPDDYLMISRFIITCCAADVYPVGLPVKLQDPRTNYPADAWFRVQGEMVTETLDGLRQATVLATSLTPISEPENPYDY